MDNEKQVLLEVKNLSVDFQVDKKLVLHAVRDVSFELDRGETLGILGESGCGKSVSCMSILRLNPVRTTRYKGQVLFKGEDLLTMDAKALQKVRGNEISMIFQEPMTALNPLFTIGYQLREAIRVHNKNVTRSEAEDRVMAAIESVRIPNPKRIIDSYPFTLSGGMLQRCMIAMAMLSEPSILICDEPTTALDVTIQAQVLDLMNDLKEKKNTSIIFITHDLGVISEMSDKVLVMYGGKKCEEGSVVDAFVHSKHPYTKGLVGSHMSPEFKGDRLPTIEGSVPSLKHMPPGCPFQNRCKFAQDRCEHEFPEYTDFGNGHRAACFAIDSEGGSK